MSTSNPKYGFTGREKSFFGPVVREIVALRDFGHVKKGETGGWIQSEKNLSQSGTSWVAQNCYAISDSRILGNALLMGQNLSIDNACSFDDNSILSGNGLAIKNDGVARGRTVINGVDTILNLNSQTLEDTISIDGHLNLLANGAVGQNKLLDNPGITITCGDDAWGFQKRSSFSRTSASDHNLLDMVREVSLGNNPQPKPAP